MDLTISETVALGWVQKIIGAAILLQSFEFWPLRQSLTQVWRWDIIQKDFSYFPIIIQNFFHLFLKTPYFFYLLILRGSMAFILLVSETPAPFPFFPFCHLFLLVSTTMIALRWRGSFNGGSDFMTLIILLALSIATLNPESSQIQKGCLWYIAIQTCTSYFVAGIIKIQKKNWRNGVALKGFLQSTIYPTPFFLLKLMNSSLPMVFLSWLLLIFECSFPLALVNSGLASFMIVLAFSFHLINIYVFGLNRFFWVWSSTYPALYYCSQGLS